MLFLYSYITFLNYLLTIETTISLAISKIHFLLKVHLDYNNLDNFFLYRNSLLSSLPTHRLLFIQKSCEIFGYLINFILSSEALQATS